MTTVPLLEAERLTVRRVGRAVLDDVSMAVASGDTVTGCGWKHHQGASSRSGLTGGRAGH
jgi:ABC-type hemin transport system ATPase subunit